VSSSQGALDAIAEPVNLPKPTLPKSALSAVLAQEAHTNHDHYGDSTIESLEDLAHLDSSEPTATLDLELPAEAPRTEAENKRYEEIQTLQLMNQSLKAARTSIRNTSRELKSLEEAVHGSEEREEDQLADAAAANGGERRKSVGKNVRTTSQHNTTTRTTKNSAIVNDVRGDNSGVQCIHCGCPANFYTNPFGALWTAFLHFFIRREGRVLRLTWLSLFLLAVISWFVTESVLWYVVPAFFTILFPVHEVQDDAAEHAIIERDTQ